MDITAAVAITVIHALMYEFFKSQNTMQNYIAEDCFKEYSQTV